jgi:hypothetical protein
MFFIENLSKIRYVMLNLYYYYVIVIGNLNYSNKIIIKIIKMKIKSNAHQALEFLDIEQSLGLVFTSDAIAVEVVNKECYGYGNR